MTLPMDSQELLRRVDRPDFRGDHEPAINLFANMLAAALNPWFDLALLTESTHRPERKTGNCCKRGAWEENRTPDLRITSALLYRLSYPGELDPVPSRKLIPTGSQHGTGGVPSDQSFKPIKGYPTDRPLPVGSPCLPWARSPHRRRRTRQRDHPLRGERTSPIALRSSPQRSMTVSTVARRREPSVSCRMIGWRRDQRDHPTYLGFARSGHAHR